jgi:hypothetical protein
LVYCLQPGSGAGGFFPFFMVGSCVYFARICGLYWSFPGAICFTHVMEKTHEACALIFSKWLSS